MTTSKAREVCKNGLHENLWFVRANGTRYCAPCYRYYEAVRDYKRTGHLGSKRLLDIETYLDSRMELIANEIQNLKNEMKSLQTEKAKYTIIAKTKKQSR